MEEPTSLLDILIKAEHEIQQNEAGDPLDKIGDIGESVMNELSGSGNGELDEAAIQNAFKLFGEAMSYKPVVDQTKKKRRYIRWNQMDAPKKTEAKTNKFVPRAKFDVDCSEFFQNDQQSDAQFEILHQKLEEERQKILADHINRDVDRLLLAANKMYGPRSWSSSEKTEFSKFCRKLRENGALNAEEKLELKGFYVKAFDLKDDQTRNMNLLLGEEEEEEETMKSPVKRKSNHKEEELMLYPKLEMVEDVKTESGEEGCSVPPILKPQTTVPQFHPRKKYEKEKEFRAEIIDIFMECWRDPPKKRGRPRRLPEFHPMRFMTDDGGKKGRDLEVLKAKLGEMMEDTGKVWSDEELEELDRFYDMFREKMNLTIIQTKELSNFLRKAFGRLEKYEIERENDTVLQEKRKFWQEYRKNHAPVKKARKLPVRTTPVRPYIRSNIDTTGETPEQRKARKAAYLREWRVRRAEKQNTEMRTFIESLAHAVPTAANDATD